MEGGGGSGRDGGGWQWEAQVRSGKRQVGGRRGRGATGMGNISRSQMMSHNYVSQWLGHSHRQNNSLFINMLRQCSLDAD